MGLVKKKSQKGQKRNRPQIAVGQKKNRPFFACVNLCRKIIKYSSLNLRGDNMREIKKGDIVNRNSYKNDIMFYVKRILKLVNGRKIAILKGLDVRVEADAPIEDLQIVSKEEQMRREKELEDRIINKVEKERVENGNRRKEIIHTGRILHLDGDKRYSEKSMMYYRKMGLNATVKNIPENKQPRIVYRLLTIYNPEILVITRS